MKRRAFLSIAPVAALTRLLPEPMKHPPHVYGVDRSRGGDETVIIIKRVPTPAPCIRFFTIHGEALYFTRADGSICRMA